MVDTTQQEYNKFTAIPTVPYNIIKYLMDNDELIWKLLKYNDADAWRDDTDHPNLTRDEKGLLVYDGLKPINDCRLFPNLGLDDSVLVESSFVRVGMPEMTAPNFVRGYTLIGLEILTHYKVSTLSNYQSRDDTILERILTVLNGADIPGIGRIFFDSSRNSKCRVYMIGQLPYRGKFVVLCSNILG